MDSMKAILILGALLLIGIALGLYFAFQHDSKYREDCNAAGGTVVYGHSELYCVKADNFIPIGR